jgi:aminocarboxymuconate-semialdehyde decarboxylase
MGVELQALSPPPVMFCYWADARATEAFARMQNENVALPRLRVCFAHGGGAFPFTLARLDHGWKVRPEGPAAIPRPPRDYARLLYFDSLTLSAANLRFLVEQFGADHVVIGSDYPFDMGSADPVGAVGQAGLPVAAREQIERGTALRFLGL